MTRCRLCLAARWPHEIVSSLAIANTHECRDETACIARRLAAGAPVPLVVEPLAALEPSLYSDVSGLGRHLARVSGPRPSGRRHRLRTEDEIRADAAPRRPFSNGTEWEIFAARQCYECVNNDENAEPPVYCPIITVALVGNDGQPSWPKEWTSKFIRFGARIEGTDRVEVHESTSDDPQACEFVGECTEFEERRDDGPDDDDGPPPDPGPPPVCEGQTDLFGYAVDRFIEELEAPQPVPSGGVR